MEARTNASRETSFCSSLRTIFWLIVFMGWLAAVLYAQETVQHRPPVTPEDLAMTDFPEFPGAPAVCLYYERTDDREKDLLSVFKRIKILTPAGRDHANLEILYYAFLNEVRDIKVTVYENDGSSREVKPEIMEKIAAKMGGSESRIKTLAVPGISPGQIIDYEYKIGRKENAGSSFTITGGVMSIRININFIVVWMDDILSRLAANWDLQDSIYVRKARYKFVSDPHAGVSTGGKYNMAWVANHLRNVKPSINDTGLELEINDIPPFYKEEFMSPESHEKISFKIFYLDPAIKNNQEYWEKAASVWRKGAEEFMGREKALKKELQDLIGNETDAESRLKKIYERVQEIKNLDYVPEMSEKERKKIKENKNVADVLKNNYGYQYQIAKTFAALARTAGYEAHLVRVVNRDDKLFSYNLPLFNNQFDTEIVMIKLGSRFQAFDPGLPDCPYGLVYWPRMNTAALTFENGQMRIFTSPSSFAEESTSLKKARLRPDGSGNLVGSIRVEYSGQEALSRRLLHRDQDDIARKEQFEEAMVRLLPQGSKVNLQSLNGFTGDSAGVAAEFEATIAGIMHQSGDRLMLSINPLANPGRYPFRSVFRKYPIYFDYPYIESDEILIELPEGYEVEAIPEPRNRDSERASFSLKSYLDGPGLLRIERRIAIKKSLVPESEYVHLKEFFNFVQARDEQQIILRSSKGIR